MLDEIHLASDNFCKLEATQGAFGRENIITHPILPEGNAQAEGHDEIIAQALNRLEKLRYELGEKTRHSILVVVQSGIIPVEFQAETRWLDLSWALVQKNDGKLYASHSSGNEFNPTDVETARKRGFDRHAAGSIQAERLGGDPSNPHLATTANAVTRSETIQMAIESALGQMAYDSGEVIKTNRLILNSSLPAQSRAHLPVLIGSGSQHKIQSAQSARDYVFPGCTGQVDGHKSSSGINEQPWGSPETLLGALNRLSCLDEYLEDYRVILATESGIIPVTIQGDERYFDFAWTVAREPSRKTYLACSSGLEFDKAHVREAGKRGFETTTVGSIIANEKGIDGTDPHSHLTNFVVSRRRSLEQACRLVFGQMKRSMR